MSALVKKKIKIKITIEIKKNGLNERYKKGLKSKKGQASQYHRSDPIGVSVIL